MNKKRGMVLVIFVFFLLVLSISTFAYKKEIALKFGPKDIGGDYDDDCTSGKSVVDINNLISEDFDVGQCSSSADQELPGKLGCIFAVAENDPSGGDCYWYEDCDDCGWGYVNAGDIIHLTDYKKLDLVDYFGEEDAKCILKSFSFKTDTGSLLCGNEYNSNLEIYEHYWYPCESAGEILPVLSNDGANITFICLDTAFGLEWSDINNLKLDNDKDGVPPPYDCNDNDPDIYGSIPDLKEARAPICGDGKLNTCKTVPDETDECDSDKTACETNCLTKGGICSWIPTVDGKDQCCGDDGIDDLGKILNNQNDANIPYLCLNRNPELVGSNGKLEDLTGWGGTELSGEEAGTEEYKCRGDWCWVSPIGEPKFRILTIKKNLEPAYDLVSNNNYWFECKEISQAPTTEGALGISSKEKVFDAEDTQRANNFYCHKEGNHWSWTECLDEKALLSGQLENGEITNGIKSRGPGDSLFSLAFEKGPDQVITLDLIKDIYSSYYGQNFRLDFSGKKYIEFYLKFEALEDFPANVKLTIYGPKQENQETVYFEQNVLNYATNNPVLEAGKWIHLKIPVPEMLGVTKLRIESDKATNPIWVKNLYLSDDLPLICSGDVGNLPDETTWLTDMDSWTKGSLINGEKLCQNRFGENSWLGGEEITLSDRRCCGDDSQEYYSGDSKTNYGCWNSQPIGHGGLTMNLEAKVQFNENKVSLEYPEQPVSFSIIKEGSIVSCPSDFKGWNSDFCTETEKNEYCFGQTNQETCLGLPEGKENYGKSLWCDPDKSVHDALCTDDLGKECILSGEAITKSCLDEPTESKKTTLISINSNIISYSDSPKKIYTFKAPEKQVETNGENVLKTKKYTLKKQSDEMLAEAEFVSPLGDLLGREITYDQLKNYGYVDIIAWTDKVEISQQTVSGSANLIFSCNSTECLYPLPGNPPYTITNPYPDLYELWFVAEDDEYLIDQPNKEFKVPGNLKAKKVSQQVIFINAPEDESTEAGFYGCNPASFLVNEKTNLIPQGYCSVKNNLFCSPSVVQEVDKEQYTTINSWSSEPLTRVGYQKLETDASQNPAEFYQNTISQPKILDPAIPPELRNHFSIVLPAKNFLSNAEFKAAKGDIPSWEIFEGNTLVPKEKDEINKQEQSISLSETKVLRSGKIAVNQNMELQLNYDGTAQATIYLVDKDGKPEILEVKTNPFQFNTKQANYLILEFSQETISHPMLQLVDKFGATAYNYQPPDETVRAGLACCPTDHCWNGYLCVEPMGLSTTLAEHISDGRDYRCIDGQWQSLPVRWDWNFERWGFCNEESQCLVMRSDDGGISGNNASQFYLGPGNYPSCIKDQEYIFDHHCDQGDWTSRTKFLVSKLLKFAESSDYVLYCTNYQEALPDLAGKENYLGGEPAGTLQELGTIEETISGENLGQQIYSCYPALSADSEGKRLVPEKENTCINNICLLKYKEGGKFKIAFAATLNKDLTDPEKSFFYALDVPPDQVNNICKTEGSEDFIECDLSGLELEGNFWYWPKLNAVIYGKEGIKLSPGIINKILNWLKNFFGKTQEEQSGALQFIEQAGNFREAYLLSQEGKKVMAVKESFSKENQTLVAKYQGFTTSICSYANNLKVPEDLKEEQLEILSGMEKLACTDEKGIQTVWAKAGLDFLWPELTAKLRVEGMN